MVADSVKFALQSHDDEALSSACFQDVSGLDGSRDPAELAEKTIIAGVCRQALDGDTSRAYDRLVVALLR